MSLPGKLLLWGYHQPVGFLRESWRHGGPVAQWRTRRGRREMERAAMRLPPLPQHHGASEVTLHLMTGRRFWYQTGFCLHSFVQTSGTALRAELYDDGSIDDEIRDRLSVLGSRIRIHSQAELQEQLESRLPRDRFPTLHDRWLNYPNIRKLIDVHVAGHGWKLVIDSDILFFRSPVELLNWFPNPRPLYARDCRESYGYSRGLLERLAGAPLPDRLNVGVCGLESQALDWDLLESWTRRLIEAEGTNYYLEQALIAMNAARQPKRIMLPGEDYITFPDAEEARNPSAVMHHYVDTSKRWYFSGTWKRFV